jgi:hypothetical protein
MPEKKQVETTTLYEVLTRLSGFDQPLICHIDEDERDRLTQVLEADDKDLPKFYGFELRDGFECYINLSSVVKLNLLDYLAGVPFEKPPKRTEEEWQKLLEERENSEATVIMKLWSAGETDVYPDVEYEEWILIRTTLEEYNQQFFGFTDEDGERVILRTACVDAVEVFDLHFLSEEDLQRVLNRLSAKTDTPADEPADEN